MSGNAAGGWAGRLDKKRARVKKKEYWPGFDVAKLPQTGWRGHTRTAELRQIAEFA
jgi:hypothetical protein